MNEWKNVKTDGDIEELMDRMGWFHDTCVKSATFKTGKYVDKDGTMFLSYEAKTYTLLLTIHSQWTKKPLEMLFTGVYKANLTGYSEKDDGIIFDAHLAFHEDVPGAEGKKLIVWADWEGFQPEKTEPNDTTTYIFAEGLSWREIE